MPKENKSIVLFEADPVRRSWSEKEEKWYFSVVDVIKVLTGSSIPRRYWSDLKIKLTHEGSEVYEKIVQLKMLADDGKQRETDVADVETMLRLVQSVPSPKAEPFKLWLAKVGYERLKETVDPEMAVNRARNNWLKMGRSAKWIEMRMRGQEIRNKLTDYWSDHEISEAEEFARLTDIIHEEWAGLTTKQHKQLKNLKGHNLRDHMTEAEIIFTSLAELSTRQIAEVDKAVGFIPNAVSAKKGGRIAKNARRELEQKTGKSVVTGQNFLQGKAGQKKLK